MTDQTQQANIDPTAPARPDELTVLKQRAATMGITHSNNISAETLKAKIQAKLDGTPDVPETPAPAQPNAFDAAAAVAQAKTAEAETVQAAIKFEDAPVRQMSLREYMIAEEMQLLRCRITNLDPKKQTLPGEILTVANEYLGTVRKFVPFGEFTDEGYHIPKCLYNLMKAKRFLHIQVKKDRKTGTEQVTSRWAPEFSIEIMEPLTKEELRELAQAQIAAGSLAGIDGDE